MEEDIDRIENLIFEMRMMGLTKESLEDVHSLENLIKGYRTLERECAKCVIRDRLHDYVENSIPKSKIKEKIEEYKKLNKGNNEYILSGYYETKIQVLQELMEDK